MLTFEEENDLINDIREGAALALEEGELRDEGYIDNIKLNKLAYLAIQEFNLDITYGWFKYGPAPVDSTSTNETATVSPMTLDQAPAARQSRVPRLDNKYLSPREYCYFFLETIGDEFRQIVQSDTKEYLVQFYDQAAPPDYRELYKESTRLQQTLDEIKENASWHEQREIYQEEIEERLNSVYRELLLMEQFQEAVDAYQRYTRLLKDVIIASGDYEELTAEQQRFVRSVVDFYYGSTWEYVALLVSRETVTGDNKKKLKSSIENDLQYHRDEYDREIESIRDRAQSFGLLPDAVEERKAILNDNGSNIHSYSTDVDAVDRWTKLGTEVILDANGQ